MAYFKNDEGGYDAYVFTEDGMDGPLIFNNDALMRDFLRTELQWQFFIDDFVDIEAPEGRVETGPFLANVVEDLTPDSIWFGWGIDSQSSFFRGGLGEVIFENSNILTTEEAIEQFAAYLLKQANERPEVMSLSNNVISFEKFLDLYERVFGVELAESEQMLIRGDVGRDDYFDDSYDFDRGYVWLEYEWSRYDDVTSYGDYEWWYESDDYSNYNERYEYYDYRNGGR